MSETICSRKISKIPLWCERVIFPNYVSALENDTLDKITFSLNNILWILFTVCLSNII